MGPAYKDNGLDATLLADSGINKRLIIRHSLIRRVSAHQSAILQSAVFTIKYLIP